MSKKLNLLFYIILSMPFFALAQTNGSFVFEGTNRNYIVYVPSYHNAENPAPLVLVLHGFTQTAQAIMNYSNFNDYAEEHGFIAVYPNGIGTSWNVGIGGGSSANDVGFLSALIDTLDAHYGVDLERVYSTGFSNGGFMSYRLACELNDRIAAIASVAGTMTASTYNACEPGRSFPVMHIHGTADFIVAYNGSQGNTSVNEVINFWTSNNNCPEEPEIIQLPDLVQEGSTVEQHTYAPCDDDTEVILLRVINGGHTWPGATGNSGIGNTNRDISASEEIWKFVSRFSNPIVTGISTVNELFPTVYPNPVTDGLLYINTAIENQKAAISIFSSDGRLLDSKNIPAQTSPFNIRLDAFPSGLLFILVRQDDNVFSAKIMNLTTN